MARRFTHVLLASTAAAALVTASAGPALSAPEGFLSVQVTIQNSTSIPLTVGGSEVFSGVWMTGAQPITGSVVTASSSLLAGVEAPLLEEPASALLNLDGDGSPIAIAMLNLPATGASVHGISTSSVLATSSALTGFSNPQAAYAMTLSPASTTRSAAAASMRGSMRLTLDDRTGSPLTISGVTYSSTLQWRGAAPQEGETVDGAATWRFENTDSRGDAGVILTLTGTAGERVIIASSMRADGTRATDIIAADGVGARVTHDRAAGWRVILTAA